jgi:single-stranded DNA-binding protein
MLRVIAHGELIVDPKRRTAANGNAYAVAAARITCEDGEALIASLICFESHAVAALLALGKGAAVSVAGRAKLSTWEGDNAQRHGLSVVVDKVLTVHAAGKARKAKEA